MSISRSWATPLTIGSFVLMAVTGILMFFHWDTGLNKLAHEWLGWAMVAGVVAHALANWPAFKQHFSRRTGRVIMGVFALLLAGSFVVQQQGGGSPAGAAIRALTQAPIARVAAVTGEPVEAVVQRLAAAGLQVSDPTRQSINDLTGRDRERNAQALRAALTVAAAAR